MKRSITFVSVIVVVGKVIPSPWGYTHAQDPGEGSVSGTEAMQNTWKRKEERQERVSCSETTSEGEKYIPSHQLSEL